MYILCRLAASQRALSQLRVMDRTHSQVIISAGGAGLQVEVREGEEELASLAASDLPVALGVGVVGQRVVGGGKSSRRSRQSSTASFNAAIVWTVYVTQLYHYLSFHQVSESNFEMIE